MPVDNEINIERRTIMKQITAKQYAKIRPLLLESWDKPVANAPLGMDRAYECDQTRGLVETLRMTLVVPPGEPESQMGLRPRTLQAAERGRAAVPKIQGLPAHLHAVRQARRDVSRLSEPRFAVEMMHNLA